MTDTFQKRSASTITRAITTLVVVVILAAGLVITWEIVLTLFLAVLFGVFLTHAGSKMSQLLSIPYKASLTAIIITLLCASVGTTAFFFVQINQQIELANEQIDRGAEKIQQWAKEYSSVNSAIHSTPFLTQILLPESPQKQHAGQHLKQNQTDDEQVTEKPDADPSSESKPNLNALPQPAKQAVSFVGQMFKTTFGLVVNSILILFVGLFLAVAPHTYRDGTVLLFSPERRDRIRDLMNQLGDTLWRWLIGRFASMLITGVGAWLILLLLGVPMAGTLGIMTGLLTFIPNIGSLIAFLIVFLVALSKGAATAAMVVPAYIVLQLIESYLVTPMIQQKQVSLPPAMLISFQAIMGVLFGFLGAAVASPLLAASKVIVEELYVNDYLEGQNPSS
tara:strand:+ start:35390 stop:36568 length:1179 start_codon:yes stop_codon:yes gene_type:complete